VSSGETYAANPRELPSTLTMVCLGLVGIGLVAFLFGLATDATTTWRAFHVNFLYFGTLSQAGLVLAAAMVIIGARWAGPIRHVAEGLAAWVPVSLVLFAVGNFFGREAIHGNWLHGPPAGKEAWLSFGRVFWTDFGVMAVLTLVTVMFLRTSFRPALHGAGERAPRARRMFESWTANWQGDQAEWERSQARLRVLAPIICLLYAFGSASPSWPSTR
jgi:hypothetical protein